MTVVKSESASIHFTHMHDVYAVVYLNTHTTNAIVPTNVCIITHDIMVVIISDAAVKLV